MIGQSEQAAEQSAPADGPADRIATGQEPRPAAPAPDPTRYGDWEKNGRCIDF